MILTSFPRKRRRRSCGSFTCYRCHGLKFQTLIFSSTPKKQILFLYFELGFSLINQSAKRGNPSFTSNFRLRVYLVEGWLPIWK